MDIYGIGTDIIEIERIKKAVEKSMKFVEKFYSDKEIELFKSRNFRMSSIAGNFAAKEAVSKALGTGVRNFSLRDIEILRDDYNKPYVNLYGNAKQLAETLDIAEILVSISHSKEYACANTIAIKK
ncbi:MAG: holo-ACP synthase [Firmicutes bacterium]|jgi:holo-[acyl-carrier protein] synthase|nr:holo-ACP synthase [Bacillota bacterium]